MLHVYKDMKENSKHLSWGRKPKWEIMGRVVMDAGNMGAGNMGAGYVIGCSFWYG